MKVGVGFIVGVMTGIVVTVALYRFVFIEPFTYVQLEEDFDIEETGTLKKGTIVRVDQPMSEGFTRYVLYLNLKGNKVSSYTAEHPDVVIPYWLRPVDTVGQ